MLMPLAFTAKASYMDVASSARCVVCTVHFSKLFCNTCRRAIDTSSSLTKALGTVQHVRVILVHR